MTRAVFTALAFAALAGLLAGLLAGCGGSHASGVFAVTKGMTMQQVRKLGGRAYVGSGSNCWLYHVSRRNSSVDGIRFCFTNGQVSLIQTAVHG